MSVSTRVMRSQISLGKLIFCETQYLHLCRATVTSRRFRAKFVKECGQTSVVQAILEYAEHEQMIMVLSLPPSRDPTPLHHNLPWVCWESAQCQRKQIWYTVNHWWSQWNSSQVHSLITQLKVPNYKLPGSQHNSLYHADQHATITGNHTPLKNCLRPTIRQDSVKPSISPPYNGPYRVLKRTNKAYQLDRSGRTDWISIDRLKPAYMEPASFDTYTRSGRKRSV